MMDLLWKVSEENSELDKSASGGRIALRLRISEVRSFHSIRPMEQVPWAFRLK